MSRTNKDRPLWVRANDPTERRIAVHFIKGTYQHGLSRPDCTDNCTIETSVSLPRHAWKTSDDPCGYVVDITRNYHNTPDRSTRRSAYHRLNRATVRQYGARVRAAYNAGSEWDDEGIPERTNPSIKTYW